MIILIISKIHLVPKINGMIPPLLLLSVKEFNRAKIRTRKKLTQIPHCSKDIAQVITFLLVIIHGIIPSKKKCREQFKIIDTHESPSLAPRSLICSTVIRQKQSRTSKTSKIILLNQKNPQNLFSGQSKLRPQNTL